MVPSGAGIQGDYCISHVITARDYNRAYYLRRAHRDFDIDGPVRAEPASKVSWFEHLIPHRTVLDVGCGRGEQVRVMAGLGAALVVGIEWSYDGVDIAKEFCRGIPNVLIYRRDARNYHPAIRFNVVTMFDFVEHLTKEAAQAVYSLCAKEWLAVGGHLCVMCPPHGKHIYHLYQQSRESMREDMENAGFNMKYLHVHKSGGRRVFVALGQIESSQFNGD